MPRRYIYLTHFYDQFEVLVDGQRIIRISKHFTDSGMSRVVEFDELSDGLKDQIVREMCNGDYEI